MSYVVVPFVGLVVVAVSVIAPALVHAGVAKILPVALMLPVAVKFPPTKLLAVILPVVDTVFEPNAAKNVATLELP